MASKCVHKGCGKTFSDPSEPCTYHPGPPEFHEGTKGWKCCKPRVLTFDEFLTIPPCTTGTHSTVDETPTPKPAPTTTTADDPAPKVTPISQPSNASAPAPTPAPTSAPAPPPDPESEDDDPSVPIPARTTCRRRTCGAESSEATGADRSGESCTFHPGHPVFHEGSKGWTCCKRRVLEFDAFLSIPGCATKERHMFVGSGRKTGGGGGKGVEERGLEGVRSDFYQTVGEVHASLFLKGIRKGEERVEFEGDGVRVDLVVGNGEGEGVRYRGRIPLWGRVEGGKCGYRVLGTKLELTLVKSEGRGWPVLRADEKGTGEIIQAGKAGRA